MLWSRRTIFMALVVGGPVILAVIVRVLEAVRDAGAARQRPARRRHRRLRHDDLDAVSAVHHPDPRRVLRHGADGRRGRGQDASRICLRGPIPRGAVLVGKYLAYLACTSLVVLPSVMLVYFLLIRFSEIAGHVRPAADRPRAAGTRPGRLRRACSPSSAPSSSGRWSSAWCSSFGWEQMAMALPGYMKRFTIAYYLQALVPHAMPSEGVVSILQGLFRDTPPVAVSLCLADGLSRRFSVSCGQNGGAEGIRAGAVGRRGPGASQSRPDICNASWELRALAPIRIINQGEGIRCRTRRGISCSRRRHSRRSA